MLGRGRVEVAEVDARLHDGKAVGCADVDDAVHAAQVDGDPAPYGNHGAHDAGPAAVGDNRRADPGGVGDDGGSLRGVGRTHDRVHACAGESAEPAEPPRVDGVEGEPLAGFSVRQHVG